MRMPSPADKPLPPLVVVLGPTAVGKTTLAVRLSEAMDGEIVSADSRQIYTGMDIGTAKATPEERARARHHLVDVVAPDEVLTLAQYQELAYAAITEILSRRCLPLLVGGTGQYVMAVAEGWEIPRVAPNAALRTELYREADENGPPALHERLASLDPDAAARIDPRNVRRVVRALEVCLVTGRPISKQQGKSPPPYRILYLGLSMPRPALYLRIDERVDRMLATGLLNEVERLVDSGYGFDLPAMSGVGYGQFAAFMAGQATLEDVVRDIKRATRRFVRHQSNWFRQDDPRIHWLDAMGDPYAQAAARVQDFLDEKPAAVVSGPAVRGRTGA